MRSQVFPADEHAQLSAAATLAAARTIAASLPFQGDARLTATAHELLLLLHYVPAPSWRLALALCMGQQTYLQQVRRAVIAWACVGLLETQQTQAAQRQLSFLF